jgi:hypothetical protein
LRVAKHGQTDLDLGVGQPIDRGIVIGTEAARLWEFIVGGVKAILICSGNFFHDRLCSVGKAVIVNPEKWLRRK